MITKIRNQNVKAEKISMICEIKSLRAKLKTTHLK